jgi:hypothetical protein
VAFVEYAALVLLERPGRRGTAERLVTVGGPEMEAWTPLLREIIAFSSLAESRRVTPDIRAQDPLSEVRRKIVTRELFLRNPIYDWQEEATLQALFSPVQVHDDLVLRAGFDLEDALALLEAFSSIGFSRLRERRERALEFEQTLTQAVHKMRAGTPPDDKALDETVRALASLSSTEAAERIRALAISWVFFAAGDTFQVTAEELAGTAGVTEDRVRAFLTLFSTEFGHASFGPGFVGQHALRQRPLIHDGTGNYLCTYVGNLLFALRHQLEDALKLKDGAQRGDRTWERYNRVRKSYVEETTVQHLSRALRTTAAWNNVAYTIDSEGPYELDGLVVVDTVALIVEAKAAALSSPARRGAPGRLGHDVEEVITSASGQAERLRTAFEHGMDVALTDSSGRRINLSRRDVTRVFSVVVTLDDFSGVGPTLWELVEAELLDLPEPLPWVVSLHELEIISELTEYPAMLPQYLVRRRRLNELRLVRTGDELDLFIHYLERGLFFDALLEDEEDRPDAIFVQSMTDGLDAYFMWKRGERKTPAPIPRQYMHRQFRELLDALEGLKPEGYMEIQMALLAMPDDNRKMVASRFAQMRRRSAQDGKLHDFTLSYSPSEARGITFMTAPENFAQILIERLVPYCLMKKHQVGADEWVGLAGTKDVPILASFTIHETWAPDEAMEELTAELPSQIDERQLSSARREWLSARRKAAGSTSPTPP